MNKEHQQTELPEFITPKSLKEAKIQIINLGNNINEHAYIVGKNLIYVRETIKFGKWLDWIEKNLWFKRSTARHYLKFAEKCDEKGKLLDYSDELKLLMLGNVEDMKPEAKRHAREYKPKDDMMILHGKFQDMGLSIANESVDMICTDPPWDEEWLPQWDELGAFAERVLKPGGYFFSVFGKIFLPDVTLALTKHLRYYGLFILRFDKGTNKLKGSNIVSQFNTIIGLFKPKKRKAENWVRDIFKAPREKEFYGWQQAQQPVSYLIRKFTEEGDTVLDTCGGSGTVAVCCQKLKRRCIIMESDAEFIKVIKGRLVMAQKGKDEYKELDWTPVGTS